MNTVNASSTASPKTMFASNGLVEHLVRGVIGICALSYAISISVPHPFCSLALAGVSLGTVGALLLTLPAASLPAMAMVGRALGWRTTWATAATVATGGLAAGGLLLALPT